MSGDHINVPEVTLSSSTNYDADIQTKPERLIENTENTTTTKRQWGKPDDGPHTPPHVLEPDHPLLERFQKALKDHLTRLITRLNEEVTDLEATIKDKEKYRETIGVNIYKVQQQVCTQQNKIDTCEKELETLSKLRAEKEDYLVDVRKKHKHEGERHLEWEKKERSLRVEMESLALFEKQLESWQKDMSDELAVNKRITDKTSKDKEELVKRKRQLDVIVYKLMTEIWKSEAELEEMDTELKVQEERRTELGQISTELNTDLEAIEVQQKSLLQAWGGVVVTLQQRDVTYVNLQKKSQGIKNEIRTIGNEIDAMKKSCQKEMEKNELLVSIKERIKYDIVNIRHTHNSEDNKRVRLEQEMNQHQIAIEQAEKELSKVKNENQKIVNDIKLITKEMEQLTYEKLMIEANIFKHLQERMTNDKAAKYLYGIVSKLNENLRSLEISLSSFENQDAQILLAIERQRGISKTNNDYLQDLKSRLVEQETLVNQASNHLTQIKNDISRKQRTIDQLQKKIMELIDQSGGLELTPEELKIKNLEKQIDDVQTHTNELQRFWMRRQAVLLDISHQFQQQQHDIFLLRKQIMILEQKNMRIEDEFEKLSKKNKTFTRNIANLQQQIEKLNCEIANRRKSTEEVDLDSSLLQSSYIGILKDLELECARLETDIEELEDEKNTLINNLVEVNREILAWGKQTQMANETRINMLKEKGAAGEIGEMRSEIHRMQVRFSQLRKAQERLIQDLEHCVSRRGSIADLAEARDKRVAMGQNVNRINFARKLNDMKSKIKHLNSDIKNYEAMNTELDRENEKFELEINNKREELEELNSNNKEFEVTLEEKQLEKQKNFEDLIRKQRKVHLYGDLNRGTYKLRVKSSAMELETNKHKNIHAQLCNIVEALKNDFPNHQYALKRIMNTLMSLTP